MTNFLKIIKKFRDFIYLAVFSICLCIIFGQISKISILNNEVIKQENNIKAMTEQLNNYKDELGRSNAEKHAYQLTQSELRDSIGLLKKKNMDYISYINSHMNISDTVTIETIIERNIESDYDEGHILLSKSDEFGKSSRKVSVDIPYNIYENKLNTGNAEYTLNQNIFVEGWLERNTKTKETYMHLRSDYPGVTFNSGMGIVAEPSEKFDRSMRKSNGLGVGIGPSVGIGYDYMNKKIVPTIGIGVTIGFTYTPKLLQW